MELDASPHAPRPWSKGRRALAGALWGFVLVGYLWQARRLVSKFPNLYEWTDLLISYAGGFVRRGLLGELAYRLHPFVRADLFLAAVIVLSLAFVSAAVIVLVFRDPDWPSLFYLLSPAGIFFPIWAFAAFGRRDSLIVAGFLLANFIAARIKRPWLGFALLCLVYLPLGLVHELAWCFFPLAVALLLQRSGRILEPTSTFGIGLASAVYLVACLALVVAYSGSHGQAQAIMGAWESLLSRTFERPGALQFLGMNLAKGMQIVAQDALQPRTVLGYVGAFLLTAIPVAFYAREIRAGLALDPLRGLSIAFALAALLAVFAITADWGRAINMVFLHLFIFAALLRPRGRGFGANSRLRTIGLALLLAVYAGGWQLSHWVTDNAAPMGFGPVLAWLRPVLR